MVRVRGNALSSGAEYLRKRHGEEAIAKVFAAMKPEHASIVSGWIARSNWYPFDAYIGFCEAADRILGKGDGSQARETAAIAAEADLGTFLKFVVSVFGTPSELMKRLAMVWGRYYDGGQLVVTEDGPNGMKFEVRDFPTPHALHCTIIEGFTERFLQLALKRKGKTVRCSHPKCRTEGAPVCEFVAEFMG